MRCWKMSFNPFGTGRGLSTKSLHLQANTEMSFNPFGAGRCLSTHHYHAHKTQYVSIPLEQGGVFRPGTELLNTIIERSQSL